MVMPDAQSTAPATAAVLTHLTFQHHRAGDAVEFYVGLIADSTIEQRSSVGGEREVIRFTLGGRPFLAADSPPIHEWDFTPAVSVFLECPTVEEVDRLFIALAADGVVFMPLGDYGFSARFGWCRDRFGVSWQVGTAVFSSEPDGPTIASRLSR